MDHFDLDRDIVQPLAEFNRSLSGPASEKTTGIAAPRQGGTRNDPFDGLRVMVSKSNHDASQAPAKKQAVLMEPGEPDQELLTLNELLAADPNEKKLVVLDDNRDYQIEFEDGVADAKTLGRGHLKHFLTKDPRAASSKAMEFGAGTVVIIDLRVYGKKGGAEVAEELFKQGFPGFVVLESGLSLAEVRDAALFSPLLEQKYIEGQLKFESKGEESSFRWPEKLVHLLVDLNAEREAGPAVIPEGISRESDSRSPVLRQARPLATSGQDGPSTKARDGEHESNHERSRTIKPSGDDKLAEIPSSQASDKPVQLVSGLPTRPYSEVHTLDDAIKANGLPKKVLLTGVMGSQFMSEILEENGVEHHMPGSLESTLAKAKEYGNQAFVVVHGLKPEALRQILTDPGFQGILVALSNGTDVVRQTKDALADLEDRFKGRWFPILTEDFNTELLGRLIEFNHAAEAALAKSGAEGTGTLPPIAPAAEDEAGEVFQSLDEAIASGNAPKKVVMLDDEGMFLRGPTRTLEENGIEHVVTRDPKEAIQKALGYGKDGVVFIDIFIAYGDRYTTLDHPGGPAIASELIERGFQGTIVMMSGLSYEDVQRQIRDDEVLAKQRRKGRLWFHDKVESPKYVIKLIGDFNRELSTPMPGETADRAVRAPAESGVPAEDASTKELRSKIVKEIGNDLTGEKLQHESDYNRQTRESVLELIYDGLLQLLSNEDQAVFKQMVDHYMEGVLKGGVPLPRAPDIQPSEKLLQFLRILGEELSYPVYPTPYDSAVIHLLDYLIGYIEPAVATLSLREGRQADEAISDRKSGLLRPAKTGLAMTAISNTPIIVAVDDVRNQVEEYRAALGAMKGVEFVGMTSAGMVKDFLKQNPVGLLLLDVWFGGSDRGSELLETAIETSRRNGTQFDVIVVSGLAFEKPIRETEKMAAQAGDAVRSFTAVNRDSWREAAAQKALALAAGAPRSELRGDIELLSAPYLRDLKVSTDAEVLRRAVLELAKLRFPEAEVNKILANRADKVDYYKKSYYGNQRSSLGRDRKFTPRSSVVLMISGVISCAVFLGVMPGWIAGLPWWLSFITIAIEYAGTLYGAWQTFRWYFSDRAIYSLSFFGPDWGEMMERLQNFTAQIYRHFENAEDLDFLYGRYLTKLDYALNVRYNSLRALWEGFFKIGLGWAAIPLFSLWGANFTMGHFTGVLSTGYFLWGIIAIVICAPIGIFSEIYKDVKESYDNALAVNDDRRVLTRWKIEELLHQKIDSLRFLNGLRGEYGERLEVEMPVSAEPPEFTVQIHIPGREATKRDASGKLKNVWETDMAEENRALDALGAFQKLVVKRFPHYGAKNSRPFVRYLRQADGRAIRTDKTVVQIVFVRTSDTPSRSELRTGIHVPELLKTVDVNELPRYLRADLLAEDEAFYRRTIASGKLSQEARALLEHPETIEWGKTLTPQIMTEINAHFRNDPPCRKGGPHDSAVWSTFRNLLDWAAWKKAGLDPAHGIEKKLAGILPSDELAFVASVGKGPVRKYEGNFDQIEEAIKDWRRIENRFLEELSKNQRLAEVYLRVLRASYEIALEDLSYRANFSADVSGIGDEHEYTRLYQDVQAFKRKAGASEHVSREINEIDQLAFRYMFIKHVMEFSPYQLRDWANQPEIYKKSDLKSLRSLAASVKTQWEIDRVYLVFSAAKSQGISIADTLWQEFRKELLRQQNLREEASASNPPTPSRSELRGSVFEKVRQGEPTVTIELSPLRPNDARDKARYERQLARYQDFLMKGLVDGATLRDAPHFSPWFVWFSVSIRNAVKKIPALKTLGKLFVDNTGASLRGTPKGDEVLRQAQDPERRRGTISDSKLRSLCPPLMIGGLAMTADYLIRWLGTKVRLLREVGIYGDPTKTEAPLFYVAPIASHSRSAREIRDRIKTSVKKQGAGALFFMSGGDPLQRFVRSLPFENARSLVPMNVFRSLVLAKRMKKSGEISAATQLWVSWDPYQDRDRTYGGLHRLKRKIDFGADVVVTQPPFLKKQFHFWFDEARKMGLTVKAHFMVGIPVIRSAKNLRYWFDLLGIDPERDLEARQLLAGCVAAEHAGKMDEWNLNFIYEAKRLPGVSGIHLMPIGDWNGLEGLISHRSELRSDEEGVPLANVLANLASKNLAPVASELEAAYQMKRRRGEGSMIEKYEGLILRGKITADHLSTLAESGLADDAVTYWIEFLWRNQLDDLLWREDAKLKFQEFLKRSPPRFLVKFGHFLILYLYYEYIAEKTWPNEFPEKDEVFSEFQHFLSNFPDSVAEFREHLDDWLLSTQHKTLEWFALTKPNARDREDAIRLRDLIEKGDYEGAVASFGDRGVIWIYYFYSRKEYGFEKGAEQLVELHRAGLHDNLFVEIFVATVGEHFLELEESRLIEFAKKSISHRFILIFLLLKYFHLERKLVQLAALSHSDRGKAWKAIAEASRENNHDKSALIAVLQSEESSSSNNRSELRQFRTADSVQRTASSELRGTQVAVRSTKPRAELRASGLGADANNDPDNKGKPSEAELQGEGEKYLEFLLKQAGEKVPEEKTPRHIEEPSLLERSEKEGEFHKKRAAQLQKLSKLQEKIPGTRRQIEGIQELSKLRLAAAQLILILESAVADPNLIKAWVGRMLQLKENFEGLKQLILEMLDAVDESKKLEAIPLEAEPPAGESAQVIHPGIEINEQKQVEIRHLRRAWDVFRRKWNIVKKDSANSVAYPHLNSGVLLEEAMAIINNAHVQFYSVSIGDLNLLDIVRIDRLGEALDFIVAGISTSHPRRIILKPIRVSGGRMDKDMELKEGLSHRIKVLRVKEHEQEKDGVSFSVRHEQTERGEYGVRSELRLEPPVPVEILPTLIGRTKGVENLARAELRQFRTADSVQRTASSELRGTQVAVRSTKPRAELRSSSLEHFHVSSFEATDRASAKLTSQDVPERSRAELREGVEVADEWQPMYQDEAKTFVFEAREKGQGVEYRVMKGGKEILRTHVLLSWPLFRYKFVMFDPRIVDYEGPFGWFFVEKDGKIRFYSTDQATKTSESSFQEQELIDRAFQMYVHWFCWYRGFKKRMPSVPVLKTILPRFLGSPFMPDKTTWFSMTEEQIRAAIQHYNGHYDSSLGPRNPVQPNPKVVTEQSDGAYTVRPKKSPYARVFAYSQENNSPLRARVGEGGLESVVSAVRDLVMSVAQNVKRDEKITGRFPQSSALHDLDYEMESIPDTERVAFKVMDNEGNVLYQGEAVYYTEDKTSRSELRLKPPVSVEILPTLVGRTKGTKHRKNIAAILERYGWEKLHGLDTQKAARRMSIEPSSLDGHLKKHPSKYRKYGIKLPRQISITKKLRQAGRAKLQGLNISQAARKIRVTHSGLSKYLDNHPRAYRTYGIVKQKATSIPKTLEKFGKKKLKDKTLKKVATITGLKYASLHSYFEHHPGDYGKYGVKKPVRQNIAKLLRIHAQKIKGKNFTIARVARIIGATWPGVNNHFRNHPKKFKTYGVRKPAATDIAFLLRKYKGKIKGKTVKQAAAIMQHISPGGLTQHLNRYPSKWKTFRIKKPTKRDIAQILKGYQDGALRGMNIRKAADHIGVSPSGLLDFFEIHADEARRLGVQKREPPDIPALLEAAGAAILAGLNVSRAAKEVLYVSVPGLGRHMSQHPEDFERYRMKRIVIISVALKNYVKKYGAKVFDGLSIDEVAKKIDLPAKQLYRYFFRRQKELEKHGIRKPDIAALLEAKKSEINGLMVSQATRKLGITRGWMGQHLAQNAGDYDKYEIKDDDIAVILEEFGKKKLQGMKSQEVADETELHHASLRDYFKIMPDAYEKYGILRPLKPDSNLIRAASVLPLPGTSTQLSGETVSNPSPPVANDGNPRSELRLKPPVSVEILPTLVGRTKGVENLARAELRQFRTADSVQRTASSELRGTQVAVRSTKPRAELRSFSLKHFHVPSFEETTRASAKLTSQDVPERSRAELRSVKIHKLLELRRIYSVAKFIGRKREFEQPGGMAYRHWQEGGEEEGVRYEDQYWHGAEYRLVTLTQGRIFSGKFCARTNIIFEFHPSIEQLFGYRHYDRNYNGWIYTIDRGIALNSKNVSRVLVSGAFDKAFVRKILNQVGMDSVEIASIDEVLDKQGKGKDGYYYHETGIITITSTVGLNPKINDIAYQEFEELMLDGHLLCSDGVREKQKLLDDVSQFFYSKEYKELKADEKQEVLSWSRLIMFGTEAELTNKLHRAELRQEAVSRPSSFASRQSSTEIRTTNYEEQNRAELRQVENARTLTVVGRPLSRHLLSIRLRGLRSIYGSDLGLKAKDGGWKIEIRNLSKPRPSSHREDSGLSASYHLRKFQELVEENFPGYEGEFRDSFGSGKIVLMIRSKHAQDNQIQKSRARPVKKKQTPSRRSDSLVDPVKVLRRAGVLAKRHSKNPEMILARVGGKSWFRVSSVKGILDYLHRRPSAEAAAVLIDNRLVPSMNQWEKELPALGKFFQEKEDELLDGIADKLLWDEKLDEAVRRLREIKEEINRLPVVKQAIAEKPERARRFEFFDEAIQILNLAIKRQEDRSELRSQDRQDLGGVLRTLVRSTGENGQNRAELRSDQESGAKKPSRGAEEKPQVFGTEPNRVPDAEKERINQGIQRLIHDDHVQVLNSVFDYVEKTVQRQLTPDGFKGPFTFGGEEGLADDIEGVARKLMLFSRRDLKEYLKRISPKWAELLRQNPELGVFFSRLGEQLPETVSPRSLVAEATVTARGIHTPSWNSLKVLLKSLVKFEIVVMVANEDFDTRLSNIDPLLFRIDPNKKVFVYVATAKQNITEEQLAQALKLICDYLEDENVSDETEEAYRQSVSMELMPSGSRREQYLRRLTALFESKGDPRSELRRPVVEEDSFRSLDGALGEEPETIAQLNALKKSILGGSWNARLTASKVSPEEMRRGAEVLAPVSKTRIGSSTPTVVLPDLGGKAFGAAGVLGGRVIFFVPSEAVKREAIKISGTRSELRIFTFDEMDKALAVLQTEWGASNVTLLGLNSILDQGCARRLAASLKDMAIGVMFKAMRSVEEFFSVAGIVDRAVREKLSQLAALIAA